MGRARCGTSRLFRDDILGNEASGSVHYGHVRILTNQGDGIRRLIPLLGTMALVPEVRMRTRRFHLVSLPLLVAILGCDTGATSLPPGGAGGAPEIGGAPGTGGATSSGGMATGGSSGGNIDTRGSILTDFSKYWDQFSPENAGKWGSVQGSSQNSFNWSSLDAMYKYCNDNNIVFKQHNFIWGSQQPSWTSSLTTTTGPAAVQNWMTSYCTRYPKVAIIDVVNEPPPIALAYAGVVCGGGSLTTSMIATFG